MCRHWYSWWHFWLSWALCWPCWDCCLTLLNLSSLHTSPPHPFMFLTHCFQSELSAFVLFGTSSSLPMIKFYSLLKTKTRRETFFVVGQSRSRRRASSPDDLVNECNLLLYESKVQFKQTYRQKNEPLCFFFLLLLPIAGVPQVSRQV